MYQYLVNAFCKFKNLKLYIYENWISHYLTHKKILKRLLVSFKNTFLIHGKEIKMHFPREFPREELSLNSDALFHCVFVCCLPVVICFTNSMCMKGFSRNIITRKLILLQHIITFIAIKLIFLAHIQFEFVSLFST